MFTLLWTDALLWLLVFAGLGYAAYVRRRPHLRAPWSRVADSAPGMSSAVVLILFLAIALVDSIHYRPKLEGQASDGSSLYAVEVRSLLDDFLQGLSSRGERTFSAPLATRAYAKETVVSFGGKVSREYPRLVYGGAHLANEADRNSDIAKRALAGVVAGAVVAVGLVVFVILAMRRPGVAWRSICWTLACLCVAIGPIAALSTQYHVFGTDKVGQDILYQVLKSIRTGIVIGGVTTLVTLPVGVLLGMMAGYYKGWIDDVIQYLYTVINSIPSVLLIVAAVLMLDVYIDTNPDLFPTVAQRADVRLLFLCIILGLTSWTGLARLLRGETLKLRELEYIQAAKAFGVRGGRILTRHILPNLMHIVLISIVMDFSALVLAEAVLSYLGVGVDPTMNSFGSMINSARLEMARDPMVWWSLASAFLFMFLLVLAANLFADAVRDAFDPRLTMRAKGTRLMRSGA